MPPLEENAILLPALKSDSSANLVGFFYMEAVPARPLSPAAKCFGPDLHGKHNPPQIKIMLPKSLFLAIKTQVSGLFLCFAPEI